MIRNLDELSIRLQSDQTRRGPNEPLAMTIFNTNLGYEQSTTGLNGQFVHSQLLTDCHLRMKSTVLRAYQKYLFLQIKSYEIDLIKFLLQHVFELGAMLTHAQ